MARTVDDIQLTKMPQSKNARRGHVICCKKIGPNRSRCLAKTSIGVVDDWSFRDSNENLALLLELVEHKITEGSKLVLRVAK